MFCAKFTLRVGYDRTRFESQPRSICPQFIQRVGRTVLELNLNRVSGTI